jgi:c-di-GMP-binding flagellar brake protein YcgR
MGIVFYQPQRGETGVQRRKHSRVHVQFPIALTFTRDHYEAKKFTTGYVKDLSEGGMRLCVPGDTMAQPSNTVNYYLILPAPFSQIVGNGRICWHQWDPQKEAHWVGIEFAVLTEPQRDDIKTIVQELAEDSYQEPFSGESWLNLPSPVSDTIVAEKNPATAETRWNE